MPLTRRRFLIDGLRVSALVPALVRIDGATTRSGERVLVVVQLSGGNDGLNTVVPHRQDAYHRLRPTLGLKGATLHRLDDDHGLHPSLAGLREPFDRGRLTLVHGVGYPHPDRSHFRALEIWHSGDPEAGRRDLGWLGRMADQILAASPGSMPAMHVGEEALPLALRGRSAHAPTLRDEDSLRFRDLPGMALAGASRVDEEHESGELAFLRAAEHEARRASTRLEEALRGRAHADYPDLGLARKLRLIAWLVAGGFDTRLYLVTLGSFDTHARQAALHAALLEELARSLEAFERDLRAKGCEERVLTLVFSEFGRRAAENASRGTDHGAAAPVLLLGGPGRGGLRGSPPRLDQLVDGDVGHSTDFRALYAAIERDWMGLAPSSAVPPFVLGG